MRKDSRVEVLPPWEQRRLAEVGQVMAKVRALHSEAEWRGLVAPLADLVRRLAAGGATSGAPLAPVGLARELIEPWNMLALWLLEGESPHYPEKATRVLADQLGAALAADPGPRFADWLSLAQVLERIDGTLAFLDSLAPELLRAHEEELLALHAHKSPFELLETSGRLSGPDDEERYLQDLSRRERSAPDRWDWVKQVERDAGVCMLQEPLGIQARLMGRLGGIYWLRFLRVLPHTLIRAVALREIESPDEALELLGSALDGAATDALLDEDVLILLVHRTFELWNDIQRNLKSIAVGQHREGSQSPEVIAQELAAEKDWRERELPERALALARRLMDGSGRKEGLRVAVMALRNLFVSSHDQETHEPESVTSPIIRQAFIETFVKSGRPLSEVVEAIMGAYPIKPALLSAALVVLEDTASWTERERTEQCGRIWAAYEQSIQAEPYTLDGGPAGDEKMLAYGMGGLLAGLPDPVAAFEVTYMAVRRPAEGWKVDYKQFLESIPKVAHVLTVGAMAGEWRRRNGQPAQALFRIAWERLHTWLRTPIPRPLGERVVNSAIAHVWARLRLIEGEASSHLALAELRRFERLDHILDAAINLQTNMPQFGGPDSLPLELQEVIWHRFGRMFPIIKLRKHVNPGQVARYEQDALKLTPDVQRAYSGMRD